MELEELGNTRVETFEHDGVSLRIMLPESSEALIEELTFDADERLPYWAELWPSARALARYLIDLPALPDRALELGSGVALPSLALRGRGVDVLATDYYEEALRFARQNAIVNGTELRTKLLDWRHSPDGVGRYPLIIAADVLYESRNVDALATLLPQLLSPDGVIVVADPGRMYTSDFLDRMRHDGWIFEQTDEISEFATPARDIRTKVQLYEFRRD